jgi:hypothetical protein
MKPSTCSIRLRRLILLGAVVLGTAVAPAAGASPGTPPDVQDAAAATNGAVPDVIERYAAAHPYGLSAQPTPVDRIVVQERGRQHDFGLFSLGLTAPRTSTLISRPPDVSDAADAARYGSSFGGSTGFDWGDWAIGIGTGIGLALLLGTALVVGRQQRHRVQPA